MLGQITPSWRLDGSEGLTPLDSNLLVFHVALLSVKPLILPTKSQETNLSVTLYNHHKNFGLVHYSSFVRYFSRCAMITMFGDVMVREHLVGRSSEVNYDV